MKNLKLQFKIQNYHMLFILFIALLLRISLIALPSFTIDMNSWIAWSEHMANVGPIQFYQTIWSDYAPGYLYVLWFFGWLHRLAGSVPYYMLLKIPAILADIGTGWIIYKMFKEVRPLGNSRPDLYGIIAAGLYLFNPTIIFNSTVWGQVDSVSTFLVVLSGWMVIMGIGDIRGIRKIRRIWTIGGFFILGLAAVVKPQSTIFLPVFLININIREIRELRIIGKRIIIQLVSFFVPIFALSAPFFLSDPFFGIFRHLKVSASTYPYTSVFAMNFWGIFGTWVSDAKHFLSVSYRNWGLIVFGLVYLGLVMVIRLRKRNFFIMLALITGAFFMFLTRMHERYLHPFFALILIGGIGEIRGNKRKRIGKIGVIVGIGVYVMMSVLHFVNLYYVYGYYNKNIIVNDSVVDWIGERFSPFSLVAVMIYITTIFLIVNFKFQMTNNTKNSNNKFKTV